MCYKGNAFLLIVKIFCENYGFFEQFYMFVAFKPFSCLEYCPHCQDGDVDDGSID